MLRDNNAYSRGVVNLNPNIEDKEFYSASIAKYIPKTNTITVNSYHDSNKPRANQLLISTLNYREDGNQKHIEPVPEVLNNSMNTRSLNNSYIKSKDHNSSNFPNTNQIIPLPIYGKKNSNVKEFLLINACTEIKPLYSIRSKTFNSRGVKIKKSEQDYENINNYNTNTSQMRDRSFNIEITKPKFDDNSLIVQGHAQTTSGCKSEVNVVPTLKLKGTPRNNKSTFYIGNSQRNNTDYVYSDYGKVDLSENYYIILKRAGFRKFYPLKSPRKREKNLKNAKNFEDREISRENNITNHNEIPYQNKDKIQKFETFNIKDYQDLDKNVSDDFFDTDNQNIIKDNLEINENNVYLQEKVKSSACNAKFTIQESEIEHVITSPSKLDLEVIHNELCIYNTPKEENKESSKKLDKSQNSEENIISKTINKKYPDFFTVESNTLNIEAAISISNPDHFTHYHQNPNKFINTNNNTNNINTTQSISTPAFSSSNQKNLFQIQNINNIDISNSGQKWEDHLNKDFQGDLTIRESKSNTNLKLDKFLNSSSSRTGVTIIKIEEVNPNSNPLFISSLTPQPVISHVLDKNDKAYNMINSTLNINSNDYTNFNNQFSNSNNNQTSIPANQQTSQQANSNIFKRKLIGSENKKSRVRGSESDITPQETNLENKNRLEFNNHNIDLLSKETSTSERNENKARTIPMTMNSLNSNNSLSKIKVENRYENEYEDLEEDKNQNNNQDENQIQNIKNFEEEEENEFNSEKNHRIKDTQNNHPHNEIKCLKNINNQDEILDINEDEEMVKLSERNEELKRRLNNLKNNIIKEIDNKKENLKENKINNDISSKNTRKENSYMFNHDNISDNEFSKSELILDVDSTRNLFTVNQLENKFDHNENNFSPFQDRVKSNKKITNNNNFPQNSQNTQNKSVIQDKNEIESINVNLTKRNEQAKAKGHTSNNKSIRNNEEIDITEEKLSSVKKMSNKIMNNIIYNYTNLDESRSKVDDEKINSDKFNKIIKDKHNNPKRERETHNKVSKKVEEEINNKYKRINERKLKDDNEQDKEQERDKDREIEIFNIIRNDVYKSTPNTSPKQTSCINSKTNKPTAANKTKNSEQYEKIKEELQKLNSSNLSNVESITHYEEKDKSKIYRNNPLKEVEELLATNPIKNFATFQMQKTQKLPNTVTTYPFTAPNTAIDSLRQNAIHNDVSKSSISLDHRRTLLNTQPLRQNTPKGNISSSYYMKLPEQSLKNLPYFLQTNSTNPDPFNMSVLNNSFVPFTTSSYKNVSKSKTNDKARLFFNLDEMKDRMIIDSNVNEDPINSVQNASYTYIQHHKKIPLPSMIYPSNEIDYLNARQRRKYYSQLKTLNS